ncbi:kinase-like protein [Clavulina sp. PMI_390]|nr:kinase-like protein [Clavulina sp. PMI_390]
MQKCIDSCRVSAGVTALRLRLLQDICSLSGVIPKPYWMTGVSKRGLIGGGAEANIYQGKHNRGPVVIREFRVMGNDGWTGDEVRSIPQLIIREIISHWQLRHPNVVGLLGVYRVKDDSDSEEDSHANDVPLPERPPWMVLQYAKHSSALKYLKSPDGGRFLEVVKGIVDGLVYLHSRTPPVIHGDLHDRNIIVTASGDALICDFGLSRIRHDITRTHTIIHEGGRLRFIAPELSMGPMQFRSNEASDIYSLAMTIYRLGVHKLPLWNIADDRQAVKLLETGIRPGFISELQPVSEGEKFIGLDIACNMKLWLLLQQMWVHVPMERTTASAVRDQLISSGLIPASPPPVTQVSPLLPPVHMTEQGLEKGPLDPPPISLNKDKSLYPPRIPLSGMALPLVTGGSSRFTPNLRASAPPFKIERSLAVQLTTAAARASAGAVTDGRGELTPGVTNGSKGGTPSGTSTAVPLSASADGIPNSSKIDTKLSEFKLNVTAMSFEPNPNAPVSRPKLKASAFKLNLDAPTFRPKPNIPDFEPKPYAQGFERNPHPSTLGPNSYNLTSEHNPYALPSEPNLDNYAFDPNPYAPALEPSPYTDAFVPNLETPTFEPNPPYSPTFELNPYTPTFEPISYTPALEPRPYTNAFEPDLGTPTPEPNPPYSLDFEPSPYSSALVPSLDNSGLGPNTYPPGFEPDPYDPAFEPNLKNFAFELSPEAPTFKPNPYATPFEPNPKGSASKLNSTAPALSSNLEATVFKLNPYARNFEPKSDGSVNADRSKSDAPPVFEPSLDAPAFEPSPYTATFKPNPYALTFQPRPYADVFGQNLGVPTSEPNPPYTPNCELNQYSTPFGSNLDNSAFEMSPYPPIFEPDLNARPLEPSRRASYFELNPNAPAFKPNIGPPASKLNPNAPIFSLGLATSTRRPNPIAPTFKLNPNASAFKVGILPPDGTSSGPAVVRQELKPVMSHPFFGKTVVKMTPEVYIKYDFNTFRSKVPKACTIAPTWPYSGQTYALSPFVT